ncbi:Rha family transcriptional regulator [Blautia wexlerae]|uniref:Rha family transcriptional regulator n=1 Tax=Blautia wexlerae TaxID=418240 RepID=UPI0018AAAD33|nr:Rha family transcriptional regulator [Blautia wexlerae]MDB2176091.1 Rha family transcriptional regulator [Blautia wexlerae]MDB6439439.1 Rha family transcriptional regulator [Blautia wexlerae]
MNELVYLKNNAAVCDSLQVAEKFGKRHDKLIAEIRRMYGELIGKRTPRNGGAKFFFESTYENRGKRYPMFLMTRDGFSLLVMGFTGKNALEWKLQYIRAFNQMEKLIQEKSTAAYQLSDQAEKATRKTETDIIKEFVEYARAQGSTHADHYYSNYTRLAYKAAGITDKTTAAGLQLDELSLVEHMITHTLKAGMAAGYSYRNIYQTCKDRLEAMQSLQCIA